MFDHDGAATRTNPSVVPLAGLATYFVTSIFYIFPSGTPQPADWILIVTIGATVACVWRYVPHDSVLYFLTSLFVGWVVLVNGIYFFVYHDSSFLKNILFYIYNCAVFVSIAALGYHDFESMRKTIFWSCVVALLIQVSYIEVLSGGSQTRATGTFINPNQLGYWAILIIACFGVVNDRSPLGTIGLVVVGTAAYVAALSLSKAATISSALMIPAIFLGCGVRRGPGIALAGLVVLGLCGDYLSNGRFDAVDNLRSLNWYENLEHRLTSIGEEADDNIMSRGYYRIIDNPWSIPFGAGEGDYSRLDTAGSDKEFHSTLGNLLLSYGLIGLGLFLALLWVVFARAPWPSVVYLAAIMMYGITHNGIRFSLFWVFLALVYARSRFGNDVAVRRVPSAYAPQPTPTALTTRRGGPAQP